MAKNASAVISGMGVGISILQTLVAKARAKGCPDEVIHRLATPEGEEMLEKFAELLAETFQRGKNIFRLAVGGNITTEKVVKTGKYDWANSNINSQNFPVRPRSTDQVVIELLEFDYDPTSEQVLEEARKRGLERPVYEDALFFGEQYPEEQRKHPVVFLHEPWQDPYDAGLDVVVLDGGSSVRGLALSRFRGGWGRYCRFAFIRK